MSAILVLLGLRLSLLPVPEMFSPPPPVEVSVTTVTIPTYPYAGFLETRHSDLYNMEVLWLDWPAYDASHPLPVPQAYTALVVENPWLRLTFLPALGGRLYGVTDKATGEELLYQNPVVKPTHWGPPEQGWWLAAGGIEWCLPVEEHGYEWGVPWDYAFSTTAAGATVSLWDTSATDRIRARITVHLPADQAAFQMTIRLENPTSTPVGFEFWHNAMLAPGLANTVGEHLRFVVPADEVTIHSTGDPRLPGEGQPIRWPVYNGIDYSRLGNWNQWLGFFARPRAAGDWAGVFDEATRRGVARVFPDQVAVGVKGFGFGWMNPIDPHTWTDDGSMYVELHSGPSPTFWDSVTLPAGGMLEWSETWLPVRGLPALSLTTADLALGLKAAGEDLDLGLWAAGQRDDVGLRLWRKADCTPLWQVDGLDLGPDQAYSHHLAGVGLGPDQVVLGVLQGTTLLALSGESACPQPVSHVNPLATIQTTASFPVSWSADDPAGVLTGHHVQVRDGDAEAPWSDWLYCTAASAASFAGQAGHTYTFRSRACDLFGRTQAWPVARWQDAFTTVLLQPAPVLITSDKEVHPLQARPGDTVQFQIHLRNTGNLTASVDLNDPLPAGLSLTAGPWISPGLPAPSLAGNTLLWSGSLASGQTGAVIAFEAEVVDLAPGETLTNVVWIDDGSSPLLRRWATVHSGGYVYLPSVVKTGTIQ